jgi:hypothetical protein
MGHVYRHCLPSYVTFWDMRLGRAEWSENRKWFRL